MKIIQVLTGAVACVSLIGLTPAYAANKTAAVGTLSVAKGGVKFGKLSRAGTVTTKSNDIKGSTALVAILALVAIVGGTIPAIKSNRTPTSP